MGILGPQLRRHAFHREIGTAALRPSASHHLFEEGKDHKACKGTTRHASQSNKKRSVLFGKLGLPDQIVCMTDKLCTQLAGIITLSQVTLHEHDEQICSCNECNREDKEFHLPSLSIS